MESNSYNHFRNRYQIVDEIGRGNFGQVFKVKDTIQNNIKADKKSIKPISPQNKQKILEQPKLLIKLNHPNIIKGYDYFIENKSHRFDNTIINQYLHIIMEYFEGKQLDQYLGKLTVQQVVKIYKQIKSVILYLQNLKIVHRDLSLDNILVDENMNIKITDFGIANDLKGEQYYHTQLALGKDTYRAPQVWNMKVSRNSDLWALGIIVLELYFGIPFYKLYGSSPGAREDFPNEFYMKYKQKISPQIILIVEPLLQRDYNKRKFYQEEVFSEVIVFKHVKTDMKIIRKMNIFLGDDSNIQTEGAIEIARSLKYLTKLSLSYNNIGTEGAIEIARNIKCLTSLSLAYNNIGTEGAIEIARNLNDLTQLQLDNNTIGKQGAIKIARNMKCLTQLSLAYNGIGTEGAIEIARNLKYLKKLSLDNNNIRREGVIEIARNLKYLKKLSLDNSKIGNQGAIEIARNLKNLTELSLSYNSIGTEGAIEIARNLKNLTELSLSINHIGAEGAIEIARNLKYLNQLSLGFNNIRTEGSIEIAKNLKYLTSLSLYKNDIGTEGAISIAKNLKLLINLELYKNKIGTEGVVEIAKNLKNLIHLQIYNNNIDEEGKKLIKSLMKGRQILL